MTTWSGLLTSIQPRIRLLRSFDERSHSYLGFVLRDKGRMDEETREFLVAVGERRLRSTLSGWGRCSGVPDIPSKTREWRRRTSTS